MIKHCKWVSKRKLSTQTSVARVLHDAGRGTRMMKDKMIKDRWVWCCKGGNREAY